MKHLMRTIMNSAAYQRPSKPLPANEADDRFYSRYLVRRLPAEVILDAYSQVTGVPTPFNQVTVGAERRGDADRRLPARHAGAAAARLAGRRRSSSTPSAGPSASQTCSCERQQDASVDQALHLNNGQTLNDKLRDKNSVVSKWLAEKVTDDEIVDRVFLAGPDAGSRRAEERQKFLDDPGRGREGRTAVAPRGDRGLRLGRADGPGVFVQPLTPTRLIHQALPGNPHREAVPRGFRKPSRQSLWTMRSQVEPGHQTRIQPSMTRFLSLVLLLAFSPVASAAPPAVTRPPTRRRRPDRLRHARHHSRL